MIELSFLVLTVWTHSWPKPTTSKINLSFRKPNCSCDKQEANLSLMWFAIILEITLYEKLHKVMGLNSLKEEGFLTFGIREKKVAFSAPEMKPETQVLSHDFKEGLEELLSPPIWARALLSWNFVNYKLNFFNGDRFLYFITLYVREHSRYIFYYMYMVSHVFHLRSTVLGLKKFISILLYLWFNGKNQPIIIWYIPYWILYPPLCRIFMKKTSVLIPFLHPESSTPKPPRRFFNS